MIEPVIDQGRPCRKGFFSRVELNQFIRDADLQLMAFQSFGWSDGYYHSNWSPLIPGRTNHLRGPSDVWSSIASNLADQRFSVNPQSPISFDQIANVLDDCTDEEWLARSISLSLRNMDINVENIAEFYHEQLVNILATANFDGRLYSSTQDQVLFAHVQSFFVHLGAARDYLGALIALRLGMNPRKVDSMRLLVRDLRSEHFGTDDLLDLLRRKKLLEPSQAGTTEWQVSGWLNEASLLRNQFVHRRPYGARHVEGFGRVRAIAPNIGLHRYVRPVQLNDQTELDILDVVARHYKKATGIFQDMAEASGWNTAMLKLTEKDIISLDAKKETPSV